MNESFLFIVDRYLPYPSSNGFCISNVVKKLTDLKKQVVVLCIYDEYKATGINGEIVESISYAQYYVSTFNKVFGYLDDSTLTNMLYERALLLHMEYHFMAVISVYRPIEAILCGMKLNKNLSVLHYPCFFDIPETSNMAPWKMRIVSRNYKRLYRSLVNKSKVLVLKYYSNMFCNALHVSKEEKIISIGIPNFLHLPASVTEGDDITLLYAGSFYDDIRNPEKFLSYMMFIIGSRIKLHLYSWGCDSVVDKYKAIYNGNLIIHGRADLNTVHDAMMRASILVNVSNDTALQVPGKVIEYFSTGKPVINFRFRVDDAGNCDYQKYPLIYNIDLYKGIQKEDQDMCRSFIEEKHKKVVPYEQLELLFKECTPEYIINIIM